LAANDAYLFSGGQDLVAKQWKVSSGDFIAEFSGHSGAIMGLQATMDTLFTGSVDQNVRIWNIVPPELTQTFSGIK
jgi:WD40 repeat protein